MELTTREKLCRPTRQISRKFLQQTDFFHIHITLDSDLEASVRLCLGDNPGIRFMPLFRRICFNERTNVWAAGFSEFETIYHLLTFQTTFSRVAYGLVRMCLVPIKFYFVIRFMIIIFSALFFHHHKEPSAMIIIQSIVFH